MAKPDWGALQNQFLTEHAKTKISPKAWCEANGLNYTSARRYIKLPAQNDTQSAQKKCALRRVRKTVKVLLRLSRRRRKPVAKRKVAPKKAKAF